MEIADALAWLVFAAGDLTFFVFVVVLFDPTK